MKPHAIVTLLRELTASSRFHDVGAELITFLDTHLGHAMDCPFIDFTISTVDCACGFREVKAYLRRQRGK